MQSHERVKWIYTSTSEEELEERYNEWAAHYDTDLENAFGWIGPDRAAETLSKHVLPGAKVLDVGAGTGLVGVALAARGFTNLVGIDLSEGMLAQAREKKVYRELRRMVLGQSLEFTTDEFDAAISVGVFTVAHAPAAAFDEIARIVRPGGFFVFTLRPDTYEQDGFRQKQEAIEKAGRWHLVERSEPFQTLPKGEPDVYHEVWMYQIDA